MKYAIKTIQGVIEIREDNRLEVPAGAVELTDEQYADVENLVLKDTGLLAQLK